MRTLPVFARIIQDFMDGRVSLQDAAPKLLAALDDAGPVNFSVSPKMRPLIAEMHRIKTGQPAPPRPPFAPDPSRHKGGNLDLVAGTTDSFWKVLSERGGPATLDCSHHAASESGAQRIGEWLRSRGQSVSIESPLEADDDDWVVHGKSPVQEWTRDLVTEWVSSVRSAPLEGTASIMGVSVVDA